MLMHLCIISAIAAVTVQTSIKQNANNTVVECIKQTEQVSVKVEQKIIVKQSNPMQETTVEAEQKDTLFILDEEEEYLLAKIAMAEAEGESLKGKTLVILTILNRINSNEFPNTIREVIFQKVCGVYQFSSVIPEGRWYTTEPNEDCWKAVNIVKNLEYDYSDGATYFEACKDENNWHSRNLDFLYQEGKHRFYK